MYVGTHARSGRESGLILSPMLAYYLTMDQWGMQQKNLVLPTDIVQ